MTQQFMNYIDRPKETRDLQKLEKDEMKTSFSTNMFGMLPLSLALYKKSIQDRKNKKSI